MPLAIFDLDGTLVDQRSAAHEWAHSFAEKWSIADATDSIALALTERRDKARVFEEITSRFALPVASADVWADYRAQMPHLVRCAATDLTALRDLRAAGWTLGIATNGMVDNQVGKIHATGLSQLVDGWIVSMEIGVRKPHPALFQALAQRLDCPLEGWMIGDSLEMDIAGGVGVGLSTAWITQNHHDATEPRPTIIADSVAAAIRRILE